MAMNINYFLSFVLLGLVMIYVFFEPMDIQKQNHKEVPLFSLDKFTLHELDTFGLTTTMTGSEAKRYSNRYDVKNIDYTDNSKEYTANMKAKHGLYKREILYLDGDVFFSREDGLKYFSQKTVYNKKKDVASSNVDYVAMMGENQVYGTSITVNNKQDRMNSKNVYAIYKIKENK